MLLVLIKMVSDVQKLSTVANSTIANKLMVAYILHNFKPGSVELMYLENELTLVDYINLSECQMKTMIL